MGLKGTCFHRVLEFKLTFGRFSFFFSLCSCLAPSKKYVQALEIALGSCRGGMRNLCEFDKKMVPP